VELLGDQALLVRFADEEAAFAWGEAARTTAPPWVTDVVVAYATAAVHFDADRIDSFWATWWAECVTPSAADRPRAATIEIPVCYERQLDLKRVADATELSLDAVIAAHLGTLYTVYAVGFVPGFPYLGYLPAELCGVPRLASPRQRVEPGSVGLTGRQTGVYPLARPGGWNLIGRTPLTLVDPAAGYFPLRVGMRVRFTRIDEAEFSRVEALGLRIEPVTSAGRPAAS
jgi:inhibitor of KinA